MKYTYPLFYFYPKHCNEYYVFCPLFNKKNFAKKVNYAYSELFAGEEPVKEYVIKRKKKNKRIADWDDKWLKGYLDKPKYKYHRMRMVTFDDER